MTALTKNSQKCSTEQDWNKKKQNSLLDSGIFICDKISCNINIYLEHSLGYHIGKVQGGEHGDFNMFFLIM